VRAARASLLCVPSRPVVAPGVTPLPCASPPPGLLVPTTAPNPTWPSLLIAGASGCSPLMLMVPAFGFSKGSRGGDEPAIPVADQLVCASF
jgi:hypothetical protein